MFNNLFLIIRSHLYHLQRHDGLIRILQNYTVIINYKSSRLLKQLQHAIELKNLDDKALECFAAVLEIPITKNLKL